MGSDDKQWFERTAKRDGAYDTVSDVQEANDANAAADIAAPGVFRHLFAPV